MKRAWLLGLLAALTISCSSDSGGEGGNGGGGENGECVEALSGCEATICVGNYIRSCSEDGKHFQYELCYGQTCKNGVCATAACLEPEKAECAGPTTYELCLLNMSMVTTKDCPEGTTCTAGACADIPCQAGQARCGWQTVLTCNEDGLGWNPQTCGDDQYCDDVATACVDIDAFCLDSPLGATCQDTETALQCQSTGRLLPVDCAKEQVCVDGFCQEKACGVNYGGGGSTTDATSQTDTPETPLEDIVIPEIEEMKFIDLNKPEAPPLEKVPKASVILNGGEFEMWELKFTSSKSANYVFKDKTLQISMAKGQHLMEVHFQGIEEGVVGNFSSEEPGSVNVLVLFNDGTTDQEVVQWKWMSVGFDATLDLFEPAGGWVKGTFAAVLEQAPETGEGEPVEVLNGSFEVPRKE